MYENKTQNLWVQAGQALTWKNLKDSRYWLAAFWLTYLPMWWFFGNPYLAGLAALSSLCGAVRLHSHYMRTLATRIEAKDGFSWDVAVNQVKWARSWTRTTPWSGTVCSRTCACTLLKY